MDFSLDQVVSPGGPSGPAWAFFTAITIALIGVLQQQLKQREETKRIREELRGAAKAANQASESAAQAQENTKNVSNGFANRVDRKLDAIAESQDELGKALRDHFEWHLKQRKDKENG